MKTLLKNLGIIFGTMLLIVSCSDNNENDNVEKESYQTTLKMTDAPIDNANVEAVFITVSDVKVDGNSIEGFSKTTFDLSALVNGQTKTLGNLQMEAGTYSNIELVLDYTNDMDGNSPGCYVEMADGTKDKIEASSSTVNITDSFEVFATNTNEIIIDFDLRKTIKEEQGTLESDFDFVISLRVFRRYSDRKQGNYRERFPVRSTIPKIRPIKLWSTPMKKARTMPRWRPKAKERAISGSPMPLPVLRWVASTTPIALIFWPKGNMNSSLLPIPKMVLNFISTHNWKWSPPPVSTLGPSISHRPCS